MFVTKTTVAVLGVFLLIAGGTLFLGASHQGPIKYEYCIFEHSDNEINLGEWMTFRTADRHFDLGLNLKKKEFSVWDRRAGTIPPVPPAPEVEDFSGLSGDELFQAAKRRVNAALLYRSGKRESFSTRQRAFVRFFNSIGVPVTEESLYQATFENGFFFLVEQGWELILHNRYYLTDRSSDYPRNKERSVYHFRRVKK